MDLYARSLFFISTWLICIWLRAFFCSDVGIIILFSFCSNSIYNDYFLWKTSTIVLFLNISFCFSQPCSMWFDNQCLSSVGASCIFSAVLHSGIFMHVSITFMLMPFQVSLYLCLSHGCAWIANLLWKVVVLVCTGFLCYIGECIIIIFVVSLTGLPHPSWMLPSAVYGQLSHCLMGKAVVMKLFWAMKYARASLFMLLNCVSTLVKHLLANAVGHNVMLLDASSFGNILFCTLQKTCSKTDT